MAKETEVDVTIKGATMTNQAADKPSYDWLLKYYEASEDWTGKILYAMDLLEEHFDKEGKIIGSGQWRLDEIGKALLHMKEATKECVNKMPNGGRDDE